MDLSIDRIIQIIPQYPQIHAEELLAALNELNALIGMNQVKKAVYGQLAYALMLLDNPQLNKRKYMLHTLITGPPGTGKSNLAEILGRIWAALGIIGTIPISRKDLTKEQEIILHLSRNLDFILDKAEIIRDDLPAEILCESGDDDISIEKRLNWIIELSGESIKQAAFIKGLLSSDKKPIKFKKVTRSDLVGQFQGHTADKTQKLLTEALGGVLFIDEMYQLITSCDGEDNFGWECLNSLNQFMSEHCEDLIVIGAGYESTMEETVFRVQPGLKRRFMWQFNIEPYTPEELALITRKQSRDDGWELGDDVTISWLQSLIANHLEYFKNYGGDTSRWIFYSAIEHACQRVINPTISKGILNRDMFLWGLERLKDNTSSKPSSCINMYL
jgi:SpoVK/Ycf46/Vps4 family AAA+-type ATPase